MNIKFLKEYFSEAAWEIVYKLKTEHGSRFTAYCKIIEAIGAKDAERLDKHTLQRGDALYLAAGICGDHFWSAFADHMRACINIDLQDEDLTEREAKMLQQQLKVSIS